MAGKSRYSLAMLTEAGENISSGQSKDRPTGGNGNRTVLSENLGACMQVALGHGLGCNCFKPN